MLSWSNVYSLCIMSICDFVLSHFGLEGETGVLITPVPGYWQPFT